MAPAHYNSFNSTHANIWATDSAPPPSPIFDEMRRGFNGTRGCRFQPELGSFFQTQRAAQRAGGAIGGQGGGVRGGGCRKFWLGRRRSNREGCLCSDGMAYTIPPRADAPNLGRMLPLRATLQISSCEVTIETTRIGSSPDDRLVCAAAKGLLDGAISEGISYPYETPFATEENFSAYFLSHDAFVARIAKRRRLEERETGQEEDLLHVGKLVGIFYVKPNFPGRCDHICNGGFVVDPDLRRQGIGRILGQQFLELSKALGYEAAFFNLVFEDNEASVRLWKSLGFETTGRIPRAARRKGGGYQDALQMRYDLL